MYVPVVSPFCQEISGVTYDPSFFIFPISPVKLARRIGGDWVKVSQETLPLSGTGLSSSMVFDALSPGTHTSSHLTGYADLEHGRTVWKGKIPYYIFIYEVIEGPGIHEDL